MRHEKFTLENNTAAAAAVCSLLVQGLYLSKQHTGRKLNFGGVCSR
jgi:hypothetical protein